MWNLYNAEGASDWLVIMLGIAFITRLWRYVANLFSVNWAELPPRDMVIAGATIMLGARSLMAAAAIASIDNTQGMTVLVASRALANTLTVVALIPISFALYGSRNTFRLLAVAFLGAAVVTAGLYAGNVGEMESVGNAAIAEGGSIANR